MGAETVEIKKERRSDILKVDPRSLVVEDGFNVRVDYGDIEDLARSIAQRGVMVALRGYRVKGEKGEQDTFSIVDGHRRQRAIMYALDTLNADIAYVPLILEPKGYSKEDRILDMFTLNDGKRLEPIEQAELFKRLVSLGWEPKDIAPKIGKSITYVWKMLDVANAPMKIKKAVESGDISANTVSQVITSTRGDEEKQSELVSQAIEKAKKEGRKKATTRHVKENVPKNPVNVFEEAISKLEKEFVESDFLNCSKEIVKFMKTKPSVDQAVDFIKGLS